MKKILFVLPSLTQANGISAFLINYLQNMNLNEFEISILSSDLRPSNSYLTLLKEHNVKVYLISDFRANGFKKYIKELKQFFYNNHDFDLIYSNVANQSLLIFKEAKKYGIKKFAIHSHSTKSSDNKIKKVINDILIYYMLKKVNYKIACSNTAGKSMFKNDDFILVNNAIDYDKYKFSNEDRIQLKEKLKIEDKFIIGFVGRFVPVKNIYFFEKLAENLDDNYKILMIGTGKQKSEFINSLKEKNLYDKFIFIEECSDVYRYYSVMDYFLLPSIFEGLPVVLIEAQANGVKCLVSDSVTKESQISDSVIFLNRNNIEEWTKEIEKKSDRDNQNVELNDKYNIKVQAKEFEELLKRM